MSNVGQPRLTCLREVPAVGSCACALPLKGRSWSSLRGESTRRRICFGCAGQCLAFKDIFRRRSSIENKADIVAVPRVVVLVEVVAWLQVCLHLDPDAHTQTR